MRKWKEEERVCTIKHMEGNLRNITRYTYETASFMGWRVAFSYHGHHVVQYFADREYGSDEASLAAAKEMRDEVRDSLNRAERYVERVFFQIEKENLKRTEVKKKRRKV